MLPLRRPEQAHRHVEEWIVMISRYQHARMMRSASLVIAFLWSGLGAGLVAETDGYPSRPVRIVVPYAAGASTDTLARAIAQKLEDKWKQGVYVENLAGVGGLMGAGNVAKSPADGYSFVLVTASHVITPAIMARPPFDPIKDFAPVSTVAKTPGLLLASNQSGIKTLADLIQQGRQKELSYGTSGVGSKHHVSMVEFARLAGIKMQHIPYRGSAQAMNDLVGGHLPLQLGSISFAHDFARNGQAKALAVVAERRQAVLPDVPTMIELGYPLSSAEWWVLLAPAGTPKPILTKVSVDVAETIQAPDLKAKFPADNLESSTPDDLQRFLQTEEETWGGIAKRAGLHIE
jgi:tripartite-type tricarboxylate transporter receptor subunit TctC